MEKKKLLLVSVSVGLFLVIVIGVSILAFSPKSYSAFESIRAQAAAENGGVRVVNPGETSRDGLAKQGGFGESPPPVPSITQISTADVPPPAPVNAEGQMPITTTQTAQAAQKENVIYINGENAENAVKVERLSDGNTRTYITFPNGAQDTSKASAGQPVVRDAAPVTAQATAAVEVRAPPEIHIAALPPASEVPALRTQQSASVDKARQNAQTPQKSAKQAKPDKPATAATATATAAATATTPSKPKSAPKTIPRRSDYWVQTGSFATKSRAEEASGFLAVKGIASIVQDTSVQGKMFYRVRVGPYTSQNEANYWLALVKTIDGMENSLVWKAN